MNDLSLQLAKRTALRKKTNRLRRQGITPAHLFGHDIASLALQADTAKLEQIIPRAGTSRLISLHISREKQPRSAIIREIQRHPITGQLLHVDFYAVKRGEKIEADVPIVLVGESPLVKQKACILTHGLTSLRVEGLPENIPPHFEVDVCSLEEPDQVIYVKDISPVPGVTLISDPDQMVVKAKIISVVREEVEARPAAVRPAEEAATGDTPSEEGAS
ncbi:MAG: 50S ribosomal protein L25 [Chloroflexi bacterium]|nr:50S ribosomal protein L25 [Chloroflexota bacterium]